MSDWIAGIIRGVAHYRLWIAVVLPVLGGALALASSLMTPRGRAKGLITGAYLLLAALGAAFLLFAAAGLVVGVPARLVIPMFVPGIVLAAIMGLFSPQVIREYQRFEFRKLAAEIFRRS
jgi:hypothetical protein